MVTCQLSPVIEELRRSTLVLDGAGLTDAQLLSRFIERRDAAAFEALVRRHGPMVLGVGRRLLRNHHDAEDAFQATFLVLVRRAASIVPPEKLANWLYGVAYRTALKAKATNFNRAKHEGPVIGEPEARSPQDPWDELRPLLDRELSRLPNKYRLPIVLCDLQGQSIKEAARNLNWPQGTLAGRLARARALLAKRLTRYGAVLTVGTLAAVLAEHVALASVPASVIFSTVQAAGLNSAGSAAAGLVSAKVSALTKGVLKSMWLQKIKTASALFLTLGLVGLGGAAISYSLMAGEESKGKQENLAAANKQVDDGSSKKKAVQTDKEKLQGTWTLVRLEASGKAFDADKMREVGDLTFDGNHLRCYQPYTVVPKECVLTTVASNVGSYTCSYSMMHSRWHGTFQLGASRNPKRIAITDDGPNGERWSYGIYTLDGDDLRISLCEGGGDQIPGDFKTEETVGLVCFTFRREKAAITSKIKDPTDANVDPPMTSSLPKPPPRAEEKQFKQYHVECMIVKVDSQGKDLGEDGKGIVLSTRSMFVREGEEKKIHSGGNQLVHDDREHACFLEFGVLARFKVYDFGLRVHVEAQLEEIDIDQTGQDDTQARGRSIQTIARPKLGESIKLIEKDDQGKPRHWLRIKVVKEETVQLGRAYTEPAHQDKPGHHGYYQGY